MPSYAEHAHAMLQRFDAHLDTFQRAVEAQPADPPRLPRRDLDDLLQVALQARAASTALGVTVEHIRAGRRDVVDFYVRLKGESGRLASVLSDLGAMVGRQHFVSEAFSQPLVALDESAQLVASALFPSAAEGLRPVNVKLWDFERPRLDFLALVDEAVREKRIDGGQHAAITAIGDGVIAAFASVNSTITELAEGRATDGARLRARLEQARQDLARHLGEARSRMTKDLKMFGPMIDRSAAIAKDVVALLGKVVVPIFPTHDRLGALAGAITQDMYESLTGVQAFALLNIAARMQATEVAGQPLLSAAYNIAITQVFPDRIYLEADKTLIEAVLKDPDFKKAEAALHRFKEGSRKQRKFRKGNLQLCYQTRTSQGEAHRVNVDADIDLYREVIPHLFGEVLVNHLSDSRTSQFAVRKILDEQGIAPIGGFQLMPALGALA